MKIQKSLKISIISFILIFILLLIDNKINNVKSNIKISYIFKISLFYSLYIYCIILYIGCDNISQEIDMSLAKF
jgi:hypothetical protein